MTHTEASLLIYFTNDYARFKIMNGNRQLNERKINKIIEEINSGNDMLRYYPIQVRENNERLDILDGQHRFFICRKLKRPVFYILVTEEKSMPDIAKINSNVEKWNSDDFINCYVQFSNKNYKQLRDFMDKYGFSLGISLLLLDSGSPGSESGHAASGLGEKFKQGEFVVHKHDEAVKFAETCMLFKDFSKWRSRPFIIAIYKIIQANLYSIEELMEDFKKQPDFISPQANYKSYINILEQMANARKRKRIIIA